MLEQVEAEMFEEFNQILNAQPSIVNAENPYPILNDIFHFFINYSDMAIALLGPNGDHAFVNRLKAIVKDKCFQEITAAYEGAHSERFEYFYEFIVYGCIGLFHAMAGNRHEGIPRRNGAAGAANHLLRRTGPEIKGAYDEQKSPRGERFTLPSGFILLYKLI